MNFLKTSLPQTPASGLNLYDSAGRLANPTTVDASLVKPAAKLINAELIIRRICK